MSTSWLPAPAALERLRTDHRMLVEVMDERTDEDLREPFVVQGGPLGDFCESLHDLAAHVLMWDEINLAVLAEARAGRDHWSIAARWETPDAGSMLNRAGVAAGRHLTTDLVRHRLTTVHEALAAEIARSVDDHAWPQELHGDGIGALAHRVMTVPGAPPFWHAALHLGHVASPGS